MLFYKLNQPEEPKIAFVFEIFLNNTDYTFTTFQIDRNNFEFVISESKDKYKDIDLRKAELLQSMDVNVEVIHSDKYREVVANYLACVEVVQRALKEHPGESLGIYLHRKQGENQIIAMTWNDFQRFIKELPKEYFE